MSRPVNSDKKSYVHFENEKEDGGAGGLGAKKMSVGAVVKIVIGGSLPRLPERGPGFLRKIIETVNHDILNKRQGLEKK
ncbi:hypothetical protein QS306_03955 [Paraburkholderia bonniea]|uniref:hypothetical protein n=1 Tax=Paraburkholderia bonniea TaxID=2152891 RepID=UPI001290FC94|nr:hypothetical protein [Paraburkholderia bonniea]WJF90827.1 hypothetical protein QS306_03955 [Paraburkholderia bonniea]WJF94141.1 hypothetical protein QS308_03955 [Paraburkholderia bonniea]